MEQQRIAVGIDFGTSNSAVADVSIEWCLLVLSLAPWVVVVGYELVGHRHNARMLAELGD